MTKFDKLIRQFERQPQPRKFIVGGNPQMIVGGPKARVGSYTDNFEKILKQMEK